MLKKILIAASLAAAFVVSAQVAEAKVKVFIGIGDNPGGYCAHHYDPRHCGGGGYGGGYYGGDGYYGGGYGYYPQPYYAPSCAPSGLSLNFGYGGGCGGGRG
mgnify:CR=1 FL=1